MFTIFLSDVIRPIKPGKALCAALVALFLLPFLPDQAAANSRYASIIMDFETGEILRSRRADTQLYPASLTKMMTLYLLFEALDEGKVTLDQQFTTSRKASGQQPSKLGLAAGEKIRVEDTILALSVRSANDVAMVVAESLGGSEAGFARMMNAKAAELGMTRTVFRNPHGLPNRQQVSTARDMARLARAIYADYPQYTHYFSATSFRYKDLTWRGHNHLMNRYDGMDGLKTGYINASGFNLASTAKRDGRRIIGVVFGGRTAASRDEHMAELLDLGFRRARENLGIRTAQLLPARHPVRIYDKTPPASALLLADNAGTGAHTDDSTTTAPAPPASPALGGPLPLIRPTQAIALASLSESDSAPDHKQEDGHPPIDPERLEIASLMLASGLQERGWMSQGEGDLSEDFPLPTEYDTRMAGKLWRLQVGAFTNARAGRWAIGEARRIAPNQLTEASFSVEAVDTESGTLYRARLHIQDEETATAACTLLREQGRDCLTIAPDISDS